jgi:hypothetical protein
MRLSFLAAALTLGAGWSGGALAQVKSPADLAAGIEQSRDVKVLKLKETQVDGRTAYIVSIMNLGTDSNAAFQVEQILVDAETGAPIPTYRHGPTGWSEAPGPDFTPPHEGGGPAMRRMTFGSP